MGSEEQGPTWEDVSASALMVLPFLVVLAGAQLARPFGPDQLSASDPIVQTLGPSAPWVVLGLGVLIVGGWVGRVPPGREALTRAARWSGAGALAAVVVAGGLRLAVGPELPSFIPPEESAKPGVALGLAAGAAEELVFRLALLPLLYAALRARWERTPAVVVASVLTAALFVLAHELPPAGGSFAPQHVMTRFLFPGVVMSLAFLWVSPTFLVVAHLTGHLVIPALFT